MHTIFFQGVGIIGFDKTSAICNNHPSRYVSANLTSTDDDDIFCFPQQFISYEDWSTRSFSDIFFNVFTVVHLNGHLAYNLLNQLVAALLSLIMETSTLVS